MSRQDIQKKLRLKNAEHFRKTYLIPTLHNNYIEMTEPDSPKSPTQKYRLTLLGKQLKEKLKNKILY